MDFKKHLPKLGTTNPDDGMVDFEEGFPTRVALRPDYKGFKETIYNNEQACVDVLIGLRGCSRIYQRAESKIIEEEETVSDMKKWQCGKFCSLLLNIKETIEIGSALGELGVLLERPKASDAKFVFQDKWLFGTYLYYNSLFFLNWMKKNSFPIPDELAFYENESGTLQWVTQSKRMFKYTSIDSDEQLNEFLLKVLPEILKFYNKFCQELKINEFKTKHNIPYLEYAKTALSKAQPLDYLIMDDIMPLFPPSFNEETKHRIKGQIAQNMIKRMDDKLLKVEKSQNGIQKRLTGLQKSIENP